MHIRTATGTAAATDADALILYRQADGTWLGAGDPTLEPLLTAEAGKAGKLTLLHPLGERPRRVAVVGLGDPDAVTAETIRRATGKAAAALREAGAATIAAQANDAEAQVEGALLATYRYRRYKTDGEVPPELESLVLTGEPDAMAAAVAAGQAKAAATCFARDLINTPACDLTPPVLAERVSAMAAEVGLSCTVRDQTWLEAHGFGLICGVNGGSNEPAQLLVLEHRGGGEGPPVGLIGKGVCFDSGGLSLKLGGSMATMKGDMGGAAVVLGAMHAIARLALPINVTAVVAAVQNLVGPGATRPGDIQRSYSGKTVEILNTDAEGRLILADALAYAVGDLGLRPVLDVATLTGACMRAVGPVFAGLFTPCDDLRDAIIAAGREAGERFWPLPLDEAFAEMMKSRVADLRNISQQDLGGASTAAEFLRAFVGDTPWVHLDVAGHELTDKAGDYQPEGATGFGVRTLVNWVRGRVGP